VGGRCCCGGRSCRGGACCRGSEASTQEAAMTWENVAALVRVVEDRATLAEREA
jgi:hypothetical protein